MFFLLLSITIIPYSIFKRLDFMVIALPSNFITEIVIFSSYCLTVVFDSDVIKVFFNHWVRLYMYLYILPPMIPIFL